jgi:hypothetical protein
VAVAAVVGPATGLGRGGHDGQRGGHPDALRSALPRLVPMCELLEHAGREAARTELCPLKRSQAMAPGLAPPAELLEHGKELHRQRWRWRQPR